MSKFCRLTSRGSWTVAKRGWSRSQDTSGSVTWIEVCMPITWCTCGHNFSWIPWYIELVTEPKPNGAVAKTSGLQSCFQVCTWDHSLCVSHLGVVLPSQNSFPPSWTTWRFHTLLPESKALRKALFLSTDAKLLLWNKRIQTRASYLAILLTFLYSVFQISFNKLIMNIRLG